MTGKIFDCTECGDSAFITETGVSHHGAPDEIDHDADADHIALDPQEIKLEPVDIAQARLAAANAAFESYAFGVPVLSANGWEYSSPGTEMTRVIFLEPLEDAEAADRAHFTVRFKDATSAEIAEVYAISDHGVIFGERL